ncbi:MAG: hypothetical protein HC774_01125, partial [Sphingomonadales bacterium]|nr:hypothetical protein [Sphingomonadales bacterium]
STAKKCASRWKTCIGAGCHGIAAMGFVTEFYKLSSAEKRQLTDWLAEDISGRVPLAVTLSETTRATKSPWPARRA